jgi:hypothetical protein
MIATRGKTKVKLKHLTHEITVEVEPYKKLLYLKNLIKANFMSLDKNYKLLYKNRDIAPFDELSIFELFGNKSAVSLDIQGTKSSLSLPKVISPFHSQEILLPYNNDNDGIGPFRCKCGNDSIECTCRHCNEFLCRNCLNLNKHFLHTMLKVDLDIGISGLKYYSNAIDTDVDNNMRKYRELMGEGIINLDLLNRKERIIARIEELFSQCEGVVNGLPGLVSLTEFINKGKEIKINNINTVGNYSEGRIKDSYIDLCSSDKEANSLFKNIYNYHLTKDITNRINEIFLMLENTLFELSEKEKYISSDRVEDKMMIRGYGDYYATPASSRYITNSFRTKLSSSQENVYVAQSARNITPSRYTGKSTIMTSLHRDYSVSKACDNYTRVSPYTMSQSPYKIDNYNTKFKYKTTRLDRENTNLSSLPTPSTKFNIKVDDDRVTLDDTLKKIAFDSTNTHIKEDSKLSGATRRSDELQQHAYSNVTKEIMEIDAIKSIRREVYHSKGTTVAGLESANIGPKSERQNVDKRTRILKSSDLDSDRKNSEKFTNQYNKKVIINESDQRKVVEKSLLVEHDSSAVESKTINIAGSPKQQDSKQDKKTTLSGKTLYKKCNPMSEPNSARQAVIRDKVEKPDASSNAINEHNTQEFCNQGKQHGQHGGAIKAYNRIKLGLSTRLNISRINEDVEPGLSTNQINTIKGIPHENVTKTNTYDEKGVKALSKSNLIKNIRNKILSHKDTPGVGESNTIDIINKVRGGTTVEHPLAESLTYDNLAGDEPELQKELNKITIGLEQIKSESSDPHEDAHVDNQLLNFRRNSKSIPTNKSQKSHVSHISSKSGRSNKTITLMVDKKYSGEQDECIRSQTSSKKNVIHKLYAEVGDEFYESTSRRKSGERTPKLNMKTVLEENENEPRASTTILEKLKLHCDTNAHPDDQKGYIDSHLEIDNDREDLHLSGKSIVVPQARRSKNVITKTQIIREINDTVNSSADDSGNELQGYKDGGPVTDVKSMDKKLLEGNRSFSPAKLYINEEKKGWVQVESPNIKFVTNLAENRSFSPGKEYIKSGNFRYNQTSNKSILEAMGGDRKAKYSEISLRNLVVNNFQAERNKNRLDEEKTEDAYNANMLIFNKINSGSSTNNLLEYVDMDLRSPQKGRLKNIKIETQIEPIDLEINHGISVKREAPNIPSVKPVSDAKGQYTKLLAEGRLNIPNINILTPEQKDNLCLTSRKSETGAACSDGALDNNEVVRESGRERVSSKFDTGMESQHSENTRSNHEINLKRKSTKQSSIEGARTTKKLPDLGDGKLYSDTSYASLYNQLLLVEPKNSDLSNMYPSDSEKSIKFNFDRKNINTDNETTPAVNKKYNKKDTGKTIVSSYTIDVIKEENLQLDKSDIRRDSTRLGIHLSLLKELSESKLSSEATDIYNVGTKKKRLSVSIVKGLI